MIKEKSLANAESFVSICSPVSDDVIAQLRVGDRISISGKIFTGRDAALPKIVELLQSDKLPVYGINLQGSVIFHTAVSDAGVGPTSSNKAEIVRCIPALAKAGVRIHLGKGALPQDTIKALADCNSVYAVIPPVTALLESKTTGKRVVAFEELGMEAMFELEVNGYPAIIAAAHGETIYK